MENGVAGGYKLVTITMTAVCLLVMAALTATSFNDNRAVIISSRGDAIADAKAEETTY